MPRRTIYFRDDLDARVTEAARLARRNRSDWVAMACEAALPIVQKGPLPVVTDERMAPGEWAVVAPGAVPAVKARPVDMDLDADPEATPSKSELDHDRQARINRAIDRARKR
jgi:hypothetical protein